MPSPFYPLFLCLDAFHVLIVGLGEVGRRKLAMLLPCKPARITVLEPGPLGEEALALVRRAKESGVSLDVLQEGDAFSLLEACDLVFLCTADHDLNASLARECRKRRILCNCTDNPSLGNAHVPACARKGEACAALSTAGASPALSRRWKGELEAWLEGKAPIVAFMERLRPLVLSLGRPSSENRDIFRSLAAKDLEEALASRDLERAKQILGQRLPRQLLAHIEELLS